MISLIIPTFNEEKRLGQSLQKLSDFLKNFNQEVEVLVVDDGSNDATVSVAHSFENKFANFKIIRLEKNQGKGQAVKTGALAAKGDTIVFSDADFSTPIEEISKLLEKINQGYDIAIGSRSLNRDLVKKHQSLLRERLGRIFNGLVQILAVPGITDTQCGFKAFKASSTKNIFEKQKISGFVFDVELLYLARKQGLRIAEVPVLWYNNPASKVNPIADALSTIYDLVRIRLIHH